MIKRIYNSLNSTWWNGALTGLLLVVVFLYTLMGALFEFGFPIIVGTLLGLVISLLILSLLGFLIWILKKFLDRFPTTAVIGFFAVAGSLMVLRTIFRLPDGVYYPGSLTLLVLTAILAGNIWVVAKSGFNSLSKFQKIMAPLSLVVWLAVAGWTISWLSNSGNFDLNSWATSNGISIAPLTIENPSATGKYIVKRLSYGSGKNERRPEYGKEADLITKTIDASLLLPEWKGFKKKMREWYWGFGVKEFPVNAMVWYPEGEGPFPLVLIVHGNHGMEDYSDPGYAYLGEMLASKGYIMASVDQNFINATWSGDFIGKEMQARGWLLLKHLSVWKEWSQTKEHQFFGKVNMDQIALIGHSRGGEAIAIAAAFNSLAYYPDNAALKFDFNFKIRSIVAVAPTDRRYTRRMKVKDINYLTLQGGYDSDEPSFFGMRQAERITYSTDHYFFKAGVYLPGGNHGQFNSVWKQDAGAPFSWLLNNKAMISEKDQQEVAKVYIAGFLDATLKDKKEYVPLFENWQYGKTWLPEGNYLNRFEDNQFYPIAGFEEDIDLTTATAVGSAIKGTGLKIWREAELFYRDGKDKQGNNAVILGWKKENQKVDSASYSISISRSFVLAHTIADSDRLAFALSAGNPKELKSEKEGEEKKEEKKSTGKEKAPDFSIVLIDSLGVEATVTASELISILPRWEIQYLKLKDQTAESFGDLWEPTLANYQIPFSYFVKKYPDLKISALKKIEFRFDKSESGVIIVDKIGIEKGAGI